MFGSYICRLDNKFRFYLPSVFRKIMKDCNFVLTKFDDENLVLCDADNWSPTNLINKICNSLSNDEMEKLEKYIKFNSARVTIDHEGRIQIPSIFSKRLKFESEVVVIGEGNYITLMSKKLYDCYVEELNKNVSNMMSEGRLTLLDKSRL